MTSPLRRAPVQARAKDRIERVLDAAEAVFVDVGYAGATTNEIAARAGTSIGSIYEFFGNKEAVATALADRYLAEFDLVREAGLGHDPGGPDAMDALVDVLDAFTSGHPGLGPLLRGRGSAELTAAGRALQAILFAQVERILAAWGRTPDPYRRHLIAQISADVLRCVLDDADIRPGGDRAAMVTELKLVLRCYLADARPGE